MSVDFGDIFFFLTTKFSPTIRTSSVPYEVYCRLNATGAVVAGTVVAEWAPCELSENDANWKDEIDGCEC